MLSRQNHEIPRTVGLISRYRFIFFIEMREKRKPHRSVKCFITMETAKPPRLKHLWGQTPRDFPGYSFRTLKGTVQRDGSGRN